MKCPRQAGARVGAVRHTERISKLPKTQQRFVFRMLETVLAQQGR